MLSALKRAVPRVILALAIRGNWRTVSENAVEYALRRPREER